MGILLGSAGAHTYLKSGQVAPPLASYTLFPTASVGNTPILPFSIFDNDHVEINHTF